MDLSTLILIGVLAVMTSNQVIMRWRRKVPGPTLFWGLQAVNVVTGFLIAAYGLPGMDRWPLISWVVALLLFSHVLQNLTLRSRWIRVARRRSREDEEEALLELRRQEDDATEDSTEDTQRKV